MTDSARTEEIRARVEKAGSGPWFVIRRRNRTSLPSHLENRPIEHYDDDPVYSCAVSYAGEGGFTGIINLADAEFIAHARSDVPYLLTELTALREEVERLRAGLKQLDAAAGEVIAMEEMRYAGTPLTVEPWIDRLADAVHIARRAALSPSPAQQEQP